MYAIYVYIYMVTFTSNILQMLAYIYPHLVWKKTPKTSTLLHGFKTINCILYLDSCIGI